MCVCDSCKTQVTSGGELSEFTHLEMSFTNLTYKTIIILQCDIPSSTLI